LAEKHYALTPCAKQIKVKVYFICVPKEKSILDMKRLLQTDTTETEHRYIVKRQEYMEH